MWSFSNFASISSISLILLVIEQYSLSSSAFVASSGGISRERIQFHEQLQLKKNTQLNMGAQPTNKGQWGKKVSKSSNGNQDNSKSNSLVTTITSEKEYFDFLKQNENSLCLIKFHAAWCKSCQKFGMRYNELALKESKGDADVCFGQIEFGSNRQLCKSLAIRRLPTIHFYKYGEKIDGFACGPSKFNLLLDTMSRYKEISTIDQMLSEKALHDGSTLVQSKQVSDQIFASPAATVPATTAETKEGGSNNDEGATTKTVDELLDQLSGLLSK